MSLASLPTPTGPITVDVVQALHSYEPTEEGCLPFRRGDLLLVYNRDRTGWWDGVCHGKRGWFPSEYVASAPEELVQRVLAELALLDKANASVATGDVLHYEFDKGISSTSVGTVSTAVATEDEADAVVVAQPLTTAVNGSSSSHHRPSSSHNSTAITSRGAQRAKLSIDTSQRPTLPTLTGRPHPSEYQTSYQRPLTPTAQVFTPTVYNAPGTGEADVITFQSLIDQILRPISDLATAGTERKSRFAPLANEVANAVRLLFVYCGILFEDALPVTTNSALKEHRKDIILALNQLAMSCRVALGVWPPSDAVNSMRKQALHVLQSVKRFVRLTEEVPLELNATAVEQMRQELASSSIASSNSINDLSLFSQSMLTPSKAEDAMHAVDVEQAQEFISQLEEYRSLVLRSGNELIARLRSHRQQSESDDEYTISPMEEETIWTGVKETVNRVGQMLSFLEDLRVPKLSEIDEKHESNPPTPSDEPAEKTLRDFALARDGLYTHLSELLNVARSSMGGLLPSNFVQMISVSATEVLSNSNAVTETAKALINEKELLEHLASGSQYGWRKDASSLAGSDLLALRRKARSLQQLAGRPTTPLMATSHPIHVPGMRRTTISTGQSTFSSGSSGYASPLPTVIGSPPLQASEIMPNIAMVDEVAVNTPSHGRSSSQSSQPPQPVRLASSRSQSVGSTTSSTHTTTLPTTIDEHVPINTVPIDTPVAASDVAEKRSSGKSVSSATSTVHEDKEPSSLSNSQADLRKEVTPEEDTGKSSVRFASPPTSVSSSNQRAVARQDGDGRPWFLRYDYESSDITFNMENQVTGGTFEALVERLTLHDTIIDADFVCVFMLTFRCFASCDQFLDCMIKRFMAPEPQNLSTDQLQQWKQRKQIPTRLRVFNMLKTWLETYFFDGHDDTCLPKLIAFTQNEMKTHLPNNAGRLADLIQNRNSKTSVVSSISKGTPRMFRSRSIDRLLMAAQYTQSAKDADAPPPTPILSKSHVNQLRSHTLGNITDLDPVEVARQLTLLDCKQYCAIRPYELVKQEFAKKESKIAVNVKGMSKLSNEITTFTAECVLYELDVKKRASVIKFFIKVANASDYSCV